VGDESITPSDADGLARCFTTHAGAVFGYACALTRGDRARAGDLVQAAFEAAAGAWPVLRDLDEDSQRSWLRRTVANSVVSSLCLQDAFRDRLARIEGRHRKRPGGRGNLAFSPVTLERCGQIIRELPERQHAIALMRWHLDMKQAEIAAVLGVGETTVSTTLHQLGQMLMAPAEPGHDSGESSQEGTAS
jgi:RNA polymerase sigma-70 factor (ECF subfamily)